MEKRQVLSIVTLICYLILVGLGAIFAIATQLNIDDVKQQPENDLGTALGVGIMAVLVILSAIYAAIGVIPIILKVIHIFADSKAPAIICLLFDVAYILINGALVLSELSAADPAITGIAVFGGLLLVSLIAFITNIASIKE